MKKAFSIDKIEDYAELNSWVVSALSKTHVVVLHGGLGAGKTTFLSQFSKLHLGIEDIQSPTFAIINMHGGSFDGKSVEIAHCDLYRLKNLEEAREIGIEDVIFDSDMTFIEWPKIIADLLPTHISLSFEVEESGIRSIEAEVIEA